MNPPPPPPPKNLCPNNTTVYQTYLPKYCKIMFIFGFALLGSNLVGTCSVAIQCTCNMFNDVNLWARVTHEIHKH